MRKRGGIDLKLNRIMEQKKADAILITNMLNVRYFSGFTGSTGIALVAGEKRYFITDFRYTEQAEAQVVPNGFEVVREDRQPLVKVAELLKENNVKKLAIEDSSVSLSQFRSFEKSFEGIEFVDLGDIFLRERMIKTPEEVEIIREAARITDEAFAAIKPLIKEGAVEKDLSTELEYQMKKRGADGPSFEIIVASNYRSAMPHGVASEKKLEEEGFVKFDFGCFYKGYASDMTRTVYLGKNPTEKHLEVYNTVREAQELAVKSVRAGLTTRELDRIAREYIESKGYGEYFAHGLGHGIGLQIHEYPGVSFKAEDIVLEENMVITIEPGIYLEGFGGVRIEDDIVVKKGGYEILNTTTKDLVKL